MNRQHQRPAVCRMRAQQRPRLRGSAAGRVRRTAHRPAAADAGSAARCASSARLRWPFDSVPMRDLEQRRQVQARRRGRTTLRHRRQRTRRRNPAPSDGFGRPWARWRRAGRRARRGRAPGRLGMPRIHHRHRVDGPDARQALEQRRLAGAVRSDRPRISPERTSNDTSSRART